MMSAFSSISLPLNFRRAALIIAAIAVAGVLLPVLQPLRKPLRTCYADHSATYGAGHSANCCAERFTSYREERFAAIARG